MANSKRKCPNHKSDGCNGYNRPSEGVLIKGSLYCNMDCVVQKAKQGIPKGKAIKAKAEKKVNARKKREFYENDKKTRREAAVYWFNRFIRLRDAGSPCISCGNSNPHIKYDAGHYIPAGRSSALRFNEQNVNIQCSLLCNTHMSGNGAGYRRGLLIKYGEVVVEFLEGPQPTIKITVEWYKEIEEKYKAKCKELEGI